MEHDYQKKSYKLFAVWMLLVAALTVFYIYKKPWQAVIGPGKATGILMFIMVDLLFMIIYFTESVYWVSGISYEDAAKAGRRARKQFAAKHLVVFLLMTFFLILYCAVSGNLWNGSTIRDALVSAALLCAAVLFTGKIRL